MRTKNPAVIETWGTERLLVLRRAGAVLAFGIGPRLGDADREERARSLLREAPIGIRAIRWCDQVHGTVVVSLSSKPGTPLEGPASVGRCDGLMTAEPGLAVAVWTADCVPVLLAGGGVVAAVHSGWRSTAAGIVPRVLRRFHLEYGVPTGELSVLLGPAIGGCCYEVGPEVVEALARRQVPETAWLRKGNHVDHRAFLQAELIAAGIPPDRIELVGGCTACSPERARISHQLSSRGRGGACQCGFSTTTPPRRARGTSQAASPGEGPGWQADPRPQQEAGEICGLASYRRDGSAAGRQLSVAVLGRALS